MKTLLILWFAIGYGIGNMLICKSINGFKAFFYLTLIAAICISIEVVIKEMKEK